MGVAVSDNPHASPRSLNMPQMKQRFSKRNRYFKQALRPLVHPREAAEGGHVGGWLSRATMHGHTTGRQHCLEGITGLEAILQPPPRYRTRYHSRSLVPPLLRRGDELPGPP